MQISAFDWTMYLSFQNEPSVFHRLYKIPESVFYLLSGKTVVYLVTDYLAAMYDDATFI